MVRWLYVIAIAVAAFALVFTGTISNLSANPTGVVALIVLGALAVLLFPKTRRPEHGVPFYLLYAAAYSLLESKSNGWIGFVALLMAFAVLVALLWKDTPLPDKRMRAAVIVGMVGIGLATSYFSGAPGGPGRFMWFLHHVLHLDDATATTVNFYFRKSVHVVAYGTLALSALQVARWQGANRAASWLAGYGWAIAHAMADELSQATVATRTGSPWDVLLDIAGMTTFFLLFGRWKHEDRAQ